MNELTICLTGRPGGGWGYTVRLGNRLLAVREPGSHEHAGQALKQALEDVSVIQAAHRASKEGGEP